MPETGMRILDECTYYWVWSQHGESDSGHYYDRTFVRGMVPCPLPGDIAGELEAVGFHLTPFTPGEFFSHWENDSPGDFRQHPVFEAVEISEPFPPEDLPEKLPESWVEFFSHYTASGKLKKEFRGE